jgi:hypothetical protein
VAIKVIVYHDFYGCDTGCCGHTVEVTEGDDPVKGRHFLFAHPYSADEEAELKQWARERVEEVYGAEHAADLDWANCQIYNGDDC